MEAYEARLRQLADEQERLQASALGSPRGLLGISRESAAQRGERTRRQQAIDDERAKLRADFGWLETVNEEANELRRALRNPTQGGRAAGTREQADIWLVLLSEWLSEKPEGVSESLHRFFGHFVHDRLVFSALQRSVRQLHGQSFFALRGFDVAA